MEISGRLVQTLPTQTGQGKNGEWKKCNFVIETGDKFPKKVCIVAWKDLVEQVQQIPAGSMINVSFDVESREYNGKWYTDVKAWKIASGAGGGNVSSPSNRNSAPMPASEPPMVDGIDDLPF
jgi:Domain of unknown function (DUF3127)